MISNELKKKIGKLFMLGIPGETVTEEYRELCETYYFSNFCINAANASTTEGLCQMTAELRELAYRLVGEYPFIGIDQEGGRVTRFYEGVKNIEGVTIYGDFDTERTAVVTLNIHDFDSSAVSDELAEYYDIATRPGAHCAPRMHMALGTEEQGAVRFSFAWFNTTEEVDAAIPAVREMAEE